MAKAVPLSEKYMREMLALASGWPDTAFDAGTDFEELRNAHLTNTPTQMRQALAGRYNMMEGDVRLDHDRHVVLAHGWHDEGLPLQQWLEIGAASGRLLKLDFKDSEAASIAAAMIRQQGVDPSKIMLNVTCVNWFGLDRMHPQQVGQLHQQLPEARIALTIAKIPYTNSVLQEAVRAAQQAGDPERVTFALQAQHINPHVVQMLAPYGSISAWNTPEFYDPPDIDEERQRLRAMGVDGMIDIRHEGDDNGPEMPPMSTPILSQLHDSPIHASPDRVSSVDVTHETSELPPDQLTMN